MLDHLYLVLIPSSLVCGTLIFIITLRLNWRSQFEWRAISIGVIALLFGLSAALNSGINQWIQSRLLSMLQDPLMTLIGPCLYWRSQYLIGRTRSVLRASLHLLPFALSLLTSLYFLFTLNKGEAPTPIELHTNMAVGFIAFAQLWLYFGLCLKSLKQHRLVLEDNYSQIDKLEESWQSRLLAALAISYGSVSLIYALNHGIYSIAVNKSFASIMALLVLYLAYLSLTRPQLLQKQPLKPTETEKYAKSGLDEAGKQQLMREIDELLEQRKLYLEPELSAPSLAAALGVSKQYLSETINSVRQLSFYELINHYRVEAVKAKIKADDERPLLDIAFDCGFNSKASFNRHFKNIAGQTPGEYRKQRSQRIG